MGLDKAVTGLHHNLTSSTDHSYFLSSAFNRCLSQRHSLVNSLHNDVYLRTGFLGNPTHHCGICSQKVSGTNEWMNAHLKFSAKCENHGLCVLFNLSSLHLYGDIVNNVL